MGCQKLTYREELPTLKVVKGIFSNEEKSSAGIYRYGFNGMEKDDNVKGSGNSYTTTWRQYDPRLGRWLSLDPAMAKYPSWSPYAFSFNNPIRIADPNGDEPPKSDNRDQKQLDRKVKRFGKKVDKLVDKGFTRSEAIDEVSKNLGTKDLHVIKYPNQGVNGDGTVTNVFRVSKEYQARNIDKTKPTLPEKKTNVVFEPVEKDEKFAEWEIQTYNIEGLESVEINITNFSSTAGELEVKVIDKRGAIRDVIDPATGEPIKGFSKASRTYSITGNQNTVLQVESNHNVEGKSESTKYQISFNYQERKSNNKFSSVYTIYGRIFKGKRITKKRAKQEAIRNGL